MLEPRPVASFRYRLVPPSQRDPVSMWAEWITRLRWLAIAAQACVIGFSVSVLSDPGITLPAFGIILGVLCFANLDTRRRLDAGTPIEPGELAVQLALDVLALTAMLLLAGGAANPFAVLLLVHVGMAVMMLNQRQAAGMLALVIGAYALLHTGSLPLHLEAHSIGAATLSTAGQLLAFAVTAVTLGGFLRGMVRSQRTHDLSRIREEDIVRAPDEHGRLPV